MEKRPCSSGMRYRNVEFLVSILYYSPAVVQPRKPFVQEISTRKKKEKKIVRCFTALHTFSHTFYPHTSCMYCTGRDLLFGGLQYLYMVPAQIYSMHVLLYHARSEICTISFLRMFIFSD